MMSMLLAIVSHDQKSYGTSNFDSLDQMIVLVTLKMLMHHVMPTPVSMA